MSESSVSAQGRTRRNASELAEESRRKLAKLELKAAQEKARLQKFEAVRSERDRKLDTRRKIIAGALAIEHMQRSPQFAAAMRDLLNANVKTLPDRALFGLATIDPATGQPIETAEKGALAPPRAQG